MDRIAFNKNSPKTFILAANGWSDTACEDDQVWSLVFNQSDSHPFHLYTTYGLKARAVQVYPDILSENQSLNTSENFKHPPAVTLYSPGCLQISYQYHNNLAVKFDVLTPEPSALLGTISLQNQNEVSLEFKLALIFQLLPLGKGMRSRNERVGTHQILSGQSADLSPVLFMTGGPTAANLPFPALSLPLQLPAGKSQTVTWALAAKKTQEESFDSTRKLLAWSCPQVLHERWMNHARDTLQIRTGDPDWDAVFSLAQTIPYTHFIHLDHDAATPIVVRTRLPDQPALNPQTAKDQDDLTTLELTHLAQVLLPQRPDLMASLVMKFLNRIQEDGQLHARRNTSPFIQPEQEPPLLAGLCLEIFEINRNESFLKAVFPLLCQVTDAWLLTGNSKEKSFTWQSLDQCQLYSGLYPFDVWEATGGGLDIQTAESPALLAMLLREVRSLHKSAEILKDLVSLKRYGKLERGLRKHLEAFWKEPQQAYQYRDAQSRDTPEGELLLHGRFQEMFSLDRKFDSPQRLVCHLYARDDRTRVCHLTLTGLDEDGQQQVEVFKPGEIRWIAGRSHLTSRNLYSKLKSISIKGLASEDEISLETTDLTHNDITCLAPIWSGDLPEDRLNSLLSVSLDWKHPNLSRGIPEVDHHLEEPPEGLRNAVNVLWNTLIIQGLASKGCTETAAGLFCNLMASIVKGLREYDGFFPNFQVEDGRPLGKANTISGLAPLRLFLEIAGIRILTPNRVALWGHNPFPWPLEVSWQGLSFHKEENYTRITFPDGTTYSHTGTTPVLITPESGGA